MKKILFYLKAFVFLVNAVATAGAQETAYLGGPGGCPFENSSNTSDSIAKVKASLEALKGSSDTCGERISNNATTLTSLLDGILESSFPITEIDVNGSTALTCDNYEGILAKEKELALEAKNNRYFVIGEDFLTRYKRCELFTRNPNEVNEEELTDEYRYLTQSQRYDLCVREVYSETFYRKVEECDIKQDLEKENNRNEAYRAQIAQLTEVATKLIASSEGCSNSDILRNITQSIIPLITTIGTYSVAGPFLGAGVAFGGNLASALVDRFFNANGPDEYISLLEGESEWQNLNCLYYQVQSEALSCNAPDFDAHTLSRVEIACRQENENKIIDNLADLSLIMKELGKSTTPLKQAEHADTIRKFLNKEIDFPHEGKKGTIADYLKEVVSDLVSDPSKSADIIQADRLTKILKNTEDYDKVISTQPLDTDALVKNNEELFKLVQDNSGTFDLVDAVSRHWNKQERARATGMVGKLKSIEAASPLASIIPLEKADMQSSESTKIAHDALVDLYKIKFQNRLEDQNKTFLRNRKPASDAQRNSNLDYLIPMFQSCTLNAGMYFFEEKTEGTHSVNLISQPAVEYQNVCKKFQCADGGLLPPFTPDQSEGADTLGTQFKRYQCAVRAQYNRLYKKLVRNYKNQGQICPTPSGAATTSVPNKPVARGQAGQTRGVSRGRGSEVESVPEFGNAENTRSPSTYNAYEAYDPDRNGYNAPEQSGGGGFFGAIGDFFGGIFNFLFGWAF